VLPRPKLRIRYGKYGRVISPVTTLGYVAQLVFVAALVAFLVTSALRHARSAEWLLAVPIGSFLLFLATRDLVAWASASSAERKSFRAEVERARAEREQRRVATPSMTRRECVGYLALLTLTAGFFGMVLLRVATRNHPGNNPSAAIFAVALMSVWLGGSWTIIRRYRRARGLVR
jgi:threonine/homoserine/homoserine lactone efflux protein